MHTLEEYRKINDEAAAREFQQLKEKVKFLRGRLRKSPPPRDGGYPYNTPFTLREHLENKRIFQ